MDALVIKHLSRLCRQQVEQMSDNIAQYVQARGVRGEAGTSTRGEGWRGSSWPGNKKMGCARPGQPLLS